MLDDREPGRSTREAADEVVYPDIDLALPVIDGVKIFTRRDGTPY